MVVYSKYNEPYKLSGRPVSKTADGSIYDVPSDPGIQVKILDKAYRTDAMERSVEDAIAGMGMLDVTPIKTLYQNNRFAGFVMEKAVTMDIEPDPQPDPQPDPVPVTPAVPARSHDAGAVPVLVMIAAGILMTAIIVFAIFPAISPSMDPSIRTVHLNGILMAVFGWILMLFASFRMRGAGWAGAVVGIVAYIIGAVVCYIAIAALVYLYFAAKALFIALMPAIITVVVIIMLLRSFIGGK